MIATLAFNSFHATGLFLYALKTSEYLWFSDIFRGGGAAGVERGQ